MRGTGRPGHPPWKVQGKSRSGSTRPASTPFRTSARPPTRSKIVSNPTMTPFLWKEKAPAAKSRRSDAGAPCGAQHDRNGNAVINVRLL